MSKPQAASEPSMDEILSSIRKMIADERPGPSPMPDQMGRTPFGEPAVKASGVSEFASRTNATGAPSRTTTAQPTNFNSLADALKVATGLSEQRRSLQRDIANVLERGPGAERFDAPGQQARPLGPTPMARNGVDATQDKTGARDEQVVDDGKREPMSFDFGTVVPQRPDPSTTEPVKAAAVPKVEKTEKPTAEEPRIVNMSNRGAGAANGTSLNGLNGHHGAGLNGSAAAATHGTPSTANGATVAPFPRSKDTPEKPSAKAETVADSPAPQSAAKADASSAQAEALLDAVVDLVQQQPGALSVFTSGASFIGGINKKAEVNAVIAAATAPPSETTDATGAAPVPAKMDRAAAELLRPMLRQWLADNMPRIVEEALRSELTDQVKDDKPAKD